MNLNTEPLSSFQQMRAAIHSRTRKVIQNAFHVTLKVCRQLYFFSTATNFLFLGENRVTTPTATESTLPWKRGEDDKEEDGAIKQTEFPSWANNKEYLAYNSPSATFLGKLPHSPHQAPIEPEYHWKLFSKSACD
jgi:hypothetical protein